MAPQCSGYRYCTTWINKAWVELRFCAGSKPARVVSEFRDGEVLCQYKAVKELDQWYRLKIRLNAFHRSTTTQKQFIIINHQNSLQFWLVLNRSKKIALIFRSVTFVDSLISLTFSFDSPWEKLWFFDVFKWFKRTVGNYLYVFIMLYTRLAWIYTQ